MIHSQLPLETRERAPRGSGFRDAPMLLLLHGWAMYGQHLFDLTADFDARLGIVAAQAPVRMGPGAYRWFDFQRVRDAGPSINDAEEERSLDTLLGFIDALVATHAPSDLYLLGHSQGATMMLSASLRRPPKLRGCINVNGRLLEKRRALAESPSALAGLSFFCGHGVHNDIVPLALGRATRQWLEDLGATTTYREYPIGHEITSGALADASTWLSAELDTHGTRRPLVDAAHPSPAHTATHPRTQ